VACEPDVPKLFFIKIGECTKGSPMVSPFYESRVQCEQAIYRPEDNVVLPQQDGPILIVHRIATFRV
ncbi:MAG: hypothetical protein WBV76_08890, partial [Pseudolabrys sp.]